MQKSLKNIYYHLRNMVVKLNITVLCIVCKFIYHYNSFRHYYHSEVLEEKEEEIPILFYFILFNFIKKYFIRKSLKNIYYQLNLVVK